jgi:hypothetical protein
MKIGLLGYGYWGKILSSKLEQLDDVEIIWTYTSQDDWQTNVIDLDWVFVATPNDVHFEQVKHFIEQGVNVFCEKPLTPTHEQSKELFDLAETHNVKLYVDDVFNYRDEREHINKLTGNIKVVWNKESDNVVYDLLYHDLYLLYPLIKCNKLLMEDITFEYGQSDDRTHKINDIDFTHTNDSNDALLKMISCVLNDKVDYKYNKEIVLFTNAIIEEYFNND